VRLRALKPCTHRAASVKPSGNGWSGYHRRSHLETSMPRLKLLGQRLLGRDFDPKVVEFQVRIVVMNGFTSVGIPVTEAIRYLCPGNGKP
jgi:hypothetical protein